MRSRSLTVALIVLGVMAGGSAVCAPNRERPVELKSADATLAAPLNIEALNRITRVALTGTPSELGGFVPAFDRHLDTLYRAKEPGPATLYLAFRESQLLRSFTLYPGAGRYRWALAAADSVADLQRSAAPVVELLPERAVREISSGDEVKLPQPQTVRALRLTVIPESNDRRVEIREFMLIADQQLEAISVEAPSRAVPVGDFFPLTVTGFFSGGATKALAGGNLEWSVSPSAAARVGRDNRLVARRRGSFNVSARFDRFTSAPLVLAGVEAD